MRSLTSNSFLLVGSLCLLTLGCVSTADNDAWKAQIQNEISAMGAQNWIIIAEPAYPAPSKSGVISLIVDRSTPEVTSAVLNAIESQGHVTPKIFVTRESSNLSESYAPGIKRYRNQLKTALGGRNSIELPNEALQLSVEDASNSFKTLVIKTQTALPYSSIYMELECGYWDGESETALRNQTN